MAHGATGRATATIRPVKVREYDAELHCDVLRPIGFKVDCKCGWHSVTLPTLKAARYALERHREGWLAEMLSCDREDVVGGGVVEARG